MIRNFITLFFCLIALAVECQQIPPNPNQVVDGKRQGKWTLPVDKEWKDVSDPNLAVYYRIIEYNQGMPEGIVRDYHRSGKIQWEGKLVSENPDVNEGLCTWYDDQGNKTKEITYKNGVSDGKAIYYYQGKKYSEGSYSNNALNLDWVYYGNDYTSFYQTAQQSMSLKDYPNAEDNYRKALDAAKKSIGEFSVGAMNAAWGQTYACEAQNKAEPAEKAWRETIRISRQVKEKNDLYLVEFTENIAQYLADAGRIESAVTLYKFAARERDAKKLTDNYKNYWDWKYVTDYSHNLKQYDSIDFYFQKITASVPILDGGNAQALRDWTSFSLAKKATNRFAEIEKRCDQFLRAKEQAGQRDEAYGEVWISYGRLLKVHGQNERALKCFADAREVLKSNEKYYPGYLRTLSNAAELYNSTGLFDRTADLLFVEYAQANEKIAGNWEDYADNLTNIVIYQMKKGNNEQAEALIEKLLDIYEAKAGKDDARYLAISVLLPSVVAKTGHTEKLSRIGKYSAQNKQTIKESLGISDGLKESKELGEYLQKGEYVKAITLFEKSASLIGAVYIKQNDYSALVMMNMGIAYCYRETGNFAKVEEMLLTAYQTTQQKLGRTHPTSVLAQWNMGDFYQQTGSLRVAEHYFSEALKILDETRTEANKKENDELYFNIAPRLASVYVSQGYYDDAEKMYLQTLRYKASTFGSKSEEYETINKSLGDLYQSMRLFADAERTYAEVEPVLRKRGENDGQYINLIGSMAINYQVRGKYDKVESMYLKVKNYYEKTLGNQSDRYTNTVSDLAVFYYHHQDWLKADAAFGELNQRLLYRVDNFFSSLTEQEKTSFYVAVQRTFNKYNSFAIHYVEKNPAEAGEMYDLQLMTKGLLFRATNKVRETILASKDDSLKSQYQRWLTLKDYLGKVYQMSEAEKKTQNVNEKKLEASVNQLEKDLTRHSEQFANLLTARRDWRQIQKGLKAG